MNDTSNVYQFKSTPDATSKTPPHHANCSDSIAHPWPAVRIPLLVLGHLVVFTLVYWSAFVYRFDFVYHETYHNYFVQSLPVLLVIKLVIFHTAGYFHGWWRHVAFSDLTALVKASTYATIVLVAIDHFVFPF